MKNHIYYKNKDAMGIVRISSGRQADGLSPDVQKAEILKYAKKMGLNLLGIVEIIESAKDAKARTKYKEAIRSIEKRKIGNVIFYMYDREARNFTDLEENEDKVIGGVFNIHYVKENQILHRDSPESDFLTRSFSGLINRQYVRTLRTKVNDGMRLKAESGWYPSNNPPLGYACQKAVDPETGRVKNRGGIIVPDPDEKIRKLVFSEFKLRSEGLSYEKIRQKHIEDGMVPSRIMRGYTIAAIHERMKNPFFRGSFIWQGTLYKGKHELFIPSSLIRRVDELLGLRTSAVRRVEDENTVIAGGWLKCSCGCHIVYDPKKRTNKMTKEVTTYHYYHCTNGKKMHSSMKGLSVTGDKIWEELSKSIDEVHISKEFAKEIADALNRIETKGHETTKRQIAALRVEESELQERENRLIDMLMDGKIHQDSFDNRLKRIRADRDSLYQQIEEKTLSLTSAVVESCKSVLELASQAKSLWNSIPASERKKVLDRILSNPVLNGVNVEFNLRKPFRILKEMRGDTEWCARQDSNL